MKPLAILFATSEMAPWVKTGGLGDVAAALPAALRRAGHDIRVLMPYYPALAAAFPEAAIVAEIPQLAPQLPAARLRLAVVDASRVDDRAAKAAGAAGIIRLDAHNVQIIIGPQAESIAQGMRDLCEKS